MSPEQINECKYNEESDIWSLGCIIYELAALHPPFQAQNHLALAMKIKDGKFERLPPRYSEELQRVVAWMLTLAHEKRPSVDDLMNIPQISLRIREKKLHEVTGLLKKKEEELRGKEERLNDKDL
jgi:NIMA (never in mitosis gene a)-related kinase